MPTIPLSEVTSSVASQVASVLEQFTGRGVEVWLRFGHEMNYYVVSIDHLECPAISIKTSLGGWYISRNSH